MHLFQTNLTPVTRIDPSLRPTPNKMWSSRSSNKHGWNKTTVRESLNTSNTAHCENLVPSSLRLKAKKELSLTQFILSVWEKSVFLGQQNWSPRAAPSTKLGKRTFTGCPMNASSVFLVMSHSEDWRLAYMHSHFIEQEPEAQRS